MNWAELHAIAQTRRRKLANNTYLVVHPGEVYGIKLHVTEILTYYPDGSVKLNSGGWRTITTKQRMNLFLEEVRVYQENWEWYATPPRKELPIQWPELGIRDPLPSSDVPFEDGMVWHPDKGFVV